MLHLVTISGIRETTLPRFAFQDTDSWSQIRAKHEGYVHHISKHFRG
jgi:hypothetical protein